MSRSAIVFTVAALLVFGGVLILFGCSGGSSKSAMPATVNVTVSDPATCSGPQGPYSHIYVTVTDVQINASATAGDHDPGWVDLTPSLSASPQQIDLLGQASNQCFLATLGATTALQPGSYQQIRIMLASGSITVANNQCGSAANCLMLSSDSSGTPEPLQLSSEAQTGIKIPSGQIAGGQFTIAAGETKDLNIDFNACESIVPEGSGQFRLKPVLHAGEVNLTSSSINGKVVDSVSGTAIIGGNTVVALEQKDGTGVDRVVMETVTDASGAFSFCPVTAGTYDVVIAAISGTQVSYGLTVITGVQPGNALGDVPVTVQAGTAAASITGMVTTSTGSAGTAADITISALQSITVNSSIVMVTVPLAGQSAAAANLVTAVGASCPAKTDCATYTLSVPAANPAVGVFSTSGAQTPAAPAAGAVSYTIDAIASVQGSSALDCSPSEMQASTTSSNAPLNVTAGASATAATLAFSGCQ
jgi:hypothetical protein